jgi:ketosteroid isomerase-like protein
MRRWLMLALMMMAAGSPSAAPLDDVFAADRAFAALALAKGARTAFVQTADHEAVMFRAGVGPVRGREAIGRLFEDPPAAIPTWEPEGGEIAASSDLAYTWGHFTWTPTPDGPAAGKPPLTGNYVTIWKKQADGSWKWIVDLGVPAPPQPR